MTDKDKLIALLKEFGVGFNETTGAIRCQEGMEKVDGYAGFFTDFQFDNTGKFTKINILEN